MTWRSGGHDVGTVVRLSEKDNGRVGYCWMRGRLKDGDLAVAVAHAGDCFWSYELLECVGFLGNSEQRGYRLIPGSKFGAYTLGQPAVELTAREKHLLLAGESVPLEIKAPPAEAAE